MKLSINAQIINTNFKMQGNSYIVFACSGADMIKIVPLLNDVPINFCIKGAEDQKIIGNVYSVGGQTTSGEDEEAKFKFRINCPESEKIKVAELSTLNELLLELEIETLKDYD